MKSNRNENTLTPIRHICRHTTSTMGNHNHENAKTTIKIISSSELFYALSQRHGHAYELLQYSLRKTLR